MEGKLVLKKLLAGFDEKPHENNIDEVSKIEEPSIHNTLGSGLLSLGLNSSEMVLQREEQPPTQIGLMRIKVEEAKKENQNLRAMVNQINEHYTALQTRLILAMRQNQLSTSPLNNHELQGNRQDAGKPVLSTRQLLDIGDPSLCDGNTKEGFASVENFKSNERNLAHTHNGEGEIKSQIEAKCKENQAMEVSCGKARVSIRAPSDFSLMGDGCQWRKYGQKTSKGNPCPRAYYRCSMGASCPVRKQVQRCFRDESVVITTYEGNHNHPLPPSAIPIASTTSSALKMFLSGSITTSNHSFLFPSLSSNNSPNYSCSAFATYTPSASCPTVTLDLTQPINHNSINYLYGGHNSATQTDKVIPSTLVDLVSEVIAKDPSLKEVLFTAISSLNGESHQNTNNNNIQSSKGGLDLCSKMPVIAPQQPYT